VPDQTVLPHGVMEGKGAYNRHATVPAGGSALGIPVFKEAAEKITIDPDDRPVVIADYGSSQGKNSLAPMQAALVSLRRRIGPDRAIFVFHIDQPSNDFNSLFEVLSRDPHSYAAGRNVFPAAIGRSFYEQVLPGESVHLGWCSFSALWLSRIPSVIPGHFVPVHSDGRGRALFAAQAAEDWKAFLGLRARELGSGGRLVVVLPARNDEGVIGFEAFMDHANAALGEMVDDGEIRAEERERMVLATYPRQKSELLAPFEAESQFRGLRVDHYELLSLPDALWADYKQNGDARMLAMKHALFFRSVFMPSLASSLDRVCAGDNAALVAFADSLQERLIRRLAADPAPLDSFVQAMVLSKGD
jgi:hypothetical protein